MPGLFHQPVGRRDFLKTSALAGAALVTSGCQTASRSSSSGSNDIRVALLSDTHIPGDRAKDPKRGFDPCENLRRVAADLAANPPRGVILKGDAASGEGLPADYQELKSLLDPISRVAPVYIRLGNHDDRQNFNDVFATPAGWNARLKDHYVLVIEESFIRFIVLDSLFYVNKASGLLGHLQRYWFSA
jgi:3',5'-cyclic AMP phosphodiesterase CpdA